MSRRTLVTVLLVLGVVALFAVPLLLDGGTSEYAGADSQATEVIEETGYTPWFDSLFPPSSSQVESGLFAVQAGIGGAVLGYVVGRLRSRRSVPSAAAPAPEPVERP
jgi:cobalt/nickel transport protein